VKNARMAGLAAIAASALIALLAVSSASAATTLCKVAPSQYCVASTEAYPAGTAIKGTATNFELQGKVLGVETKVACSSSTIEGSITTASGEPQSLSVSGWSFSGCEDKVAKKSCETVKGLNLPYAGSLVHKKSSSDGTLTVANGGSGTPLLKVTCTGSDCEYSVPSIEFKGGKPGQLKVSEQTLTKVGGFLCPTTTTLKPLTYTLSAPEPVYVAETPLEESHLRLCSKYYSHSETCPDASTYKPGTAIKFETSNLVFNGFLIGPVNCGKINMSFQTQAFGAKVFPIGPETWELVEGASKTCKESNGSTCTVSTSPGSFNGKIENGITNGQAEVWLTGKFEVTCGAFQCTVGLTGTVGSLQYETESITRLKYVESVMQRLSPLCPSGPKLSATFSVTSPLPLAPV